MSRTLNLFSLGLIALLISACGPDRPVFDKNPVDDLIKDMTAVPNFSIILFDMDFDEATEQYRHQYSILKEPAGSDAVEGETTDWLQVSAVYFNEQVDNMGMNIVSKVDGVVAKKVSPPGYDQYVGNEKYGNWEKKSDGTSFWAFYGQYAFMRSILGFGYSPIYRGGWNDYRRNYAPSGRAYYGSNSNGGGTRFGTSGSHVSNRSTKSTWASKDASFKSRVRSRVQRSSSRTSRTSRSSSRYRSSSSSRSRGFGGGK
jgi:hypothetical protein